jgi:DNA invertase Pin-like site-specific DNA recombinase
MSQASRGRKGGQWTLHTRDAGGATIEDAIDHITGETIDDDDDLPSDPMSEGRWFAYVRVSKDEQDTALQLRDRTIRACDKIFEEKITSVAEHRPALEACLAELTRGDTFVVWKLDRLGRTTLELLTLVESFRRRGINFVCTTVGLNTGTTAGRLVLRVLAAVAEYERDTLIERTVAGLAAAHDKGHFGGRRRLLTGEKLERARDAWLNRPLNVATGRPMTNEELAASFGMSRRTLERWARNGGIPTTKSQQAVFFEKHPDVDEWLERTNDPTWGLNPKKHVS